MSLQFFAPHVITNFLLRIPFYIKICESSLHDMKVSIIKGSAKEMKLSKGVGVAGDDPPTLKSAFQILL